MKIIIIVCMFFFSSFSDEHLLFNKPAPLFIPEEGMAEVKYTGNVTLVNFMYIGCRPCMAEIKTLNHLYDEFKNEVTFIGIASQTRKQLNAFLSEDKSIFMTIREDLKAEKPIYPIYAECSEERKNKNDDATHRTLGPECHTVSDKFSVDGYPYTFLIDKKGTVRYVQFGFPMDENDSLFYKKIKSEISKLINE